MSFLHRDKNSATRGADFSAGAQCPLDGRAIIRQIHNSGGKENRVARRSWPQQFDRIFRSDRAWRAILVCPFHQMISRCPVAMTVEQSADHAAIQSSRKGFILFLRFPLSDDFAVLWETSNMQPIRVRRTATKTHIVWRILFLKRLGSAHYCRAFDSLTPAHSASGLPVCVAGVPAAPLCETLGAHDSASDTDALQSCVALRS